MEKFNTKNQRNLKYSAPETINLTVLNNTTGKLEFKSIDLIDVLNEFPNSRPERIHQEHEISFIRCLKAFFENHFEGIVEPMYEPEHIKGLTPKEVKLIHNLYKKRIKM